MSKLVFLHSSVERETDLVSSFLDECVVHQVTSESNLESFDVTGLSHVAFVWHYPGYNSLPFFGDDVHVRDPESNQEPERPEYHYFSNKVVAWMKALPSGCKVDLLSCNLSGDDYASEVATLEGVCDVDIRYSVDQTGNNPSGNWVLESDGVDVRDVYFSESVLAWNGILNSSRTPQNMADAAPTYFSYESGVLKLLQNITDWNEFITTTNFGTEESPDIGVVSDFIILASTDTFDGQGFTINLGDNTDWAGLFACSSSGASASARAKIMNLGVLNGTTVSDGGFIVRPQQYFFEVENCYSTGSIGNWTGGICGSEAGKDGSCIVSNCYSTGSIGMVAGGICSNRAGYTNGSCVVSNCYSTGTIGQSAGGICGGYAGRTGGSCIVSNCYSAGSIGTDAGGICGTEAGKDGSCIVSNCYSTGSIGTDAGGICGRFAGNLGSCVVSNCYANDGTGTGPTILYNVIDPAPANFSLAVLSTDKGAINNTDPVELNGTTYLTYGGTTNSFVDVGATYSVLRGNMTTQYVKSTETITITQNTSIDSMIQLIPVDSSTEFTENANDNVNVNVNAAYVSTDLTTIHSIMFSNTEYASKQLFNSVNADSILGVSRSLLDLKNNTTKYTQSNYDVYKIGSSISVSGTPANGIYVPLSNVGDSVTINGSTITVSEVDSTTGDVSALTKDGSALAEIVDATNGNYYDIGGYKWYKGSLYTNGEEIDYSINPADLASNSMYFNYDSTNNILSLNQDVTWQDLINEPNNGVISEQSYISLASIDTFDGQGFTINLVGINGWAGLFACSGGSADVRAKIMNLGVLNGTTVGGGFIVRNEQKFFEVENCYSTGNISSNAGGICGVRVGSSGSCVVSNCYSTGSIGTEAGGICGSDAGKSGSCVISTCYSTGSIGNFAGGICGYDAGLLNGSCIVSNCYSTGNISSSAGGICGASAGDSGSCVVSNCYSTGNINFNAGGICGPNAGYSGSCVVSNCYANDGTGSDASKLYNDGNTASAPANYPLTTLSDDKGVINNTDDVTIDTTTYVTYNTNSIDSFVNLETDYPVLRGNINTDVTGDLTTGYTLTFSSVDPETGYVPLQIITTSSQPITIMTNTNVNAVVMTKQEAPADDQYFSAPTSAYFGNPEDAFKQLFTLIDPTTSPVSISKSGLGLGSTNVDNYHVYRLGSEASFTENQALETTDNGLYFPLYNENDSVTLNGALLIKTADGFSYSNEELNPVEGKTYYDIGGLKWYEGSIYTDGTLIPVIPVTLSVLVNESTGVSVDNAYKVLLSAQEYTLSAFKSTFFRYGRFRYDRSSSTPLPDLANTSNAYTIQQSGTDDLNPPDNAFDFITVAMNHFETQQTESNDVPRDTWSTTSYMSITKQLLQYKTMDNWNFLTSNSYTYSELETVYQEEKGEVFGVGSLVGISFVIANDAMNPLEIIVPIQIVAES